MQEIAKTMLIEAPGFDPLFEKKRAHTFHKSNERVEHIFKNLCKHGHVHIQDTKTAALLCNGSLYSVVMEWLQQNRTQPLTEYAYPIIIFNLNAFQLKYVEEMVQTYITETISDIDTFFHFNKWV